MGPAVICGSEAVTGWKKGADNAPFPSRKRSGTSTSTGRRATSGWSAADGAVTRLALARTPNWQITDPDDIKSEWWTWKNPDKPFDNYATVNGQRRHLAFDKEHINTSQPQDYYEGAHRLDHQRLGDGQSVPGASAGRGPRERLADVSRASGAAALPTRSSAAAVITWKTSRSTWTARASSGSTRRAGAAGSTFACPATRIRTPSESRWPGAST